MLVPKMGVRTLHFLLILGTVQALWKSTVRLLTRKKLLGMTLPTSFTESLPKLFPSCRSLFARIFRLLSRKGAALEDFPRAPSGFLLNNALGLLKARLRLHNSTVSPPSQVLALPHGRNTVV